MLTLIDLGAEFWRNWYGSKSQVDAYTLTLERIQWYWRDNKRTVVCCDSPRTLRKEWFPGYKAGRPSRPEEAWDALRSVEQRVASWGCAVVSCDGYEADDVIATLVSQAFPEDVQVIGCEKDLFCLLSDTVRLVGKQGYITANDCLDKFGVMPSQMRDWLALVGDAADAVPGCPGCGPGRASTLLERFTSLDGVRAASDDDILALPKIGNKTLGGLRQWDPTMAIKLVTLLTDAPVQLNDILEE